MNRSFRTLVLAATMPFTLCVAGQVRPGEPQLSAKPADFPTYPLKASANGRYLVDQNGPPALLMGDSPHSLFVNLSPASRCREFADAVWYLLRATDPPLNTKRTDIILTPPDADPCDSLHWYDLRIQYVPDFEVHLSGWFPAGIVRQEPSNSSIELEAENLHTKQEKWSDDDLHPDRRPDDVRVSGRAPPTAEQKRTITQDSR
jgi:hypothetical protein